MNKISVEIWSEIRKFEQMSDFYNFMYLFKQSIKLITFSTIRTIILSDEKIMECAESVTSLSETPYFMTCFCYP